MTLTRYKAERLVGRATRGRGWRARRAWHRLARACPTADEPALGILWSLVDAAPPERRRTMIEGLAGNPNPLAGRTLDLLWSRWVDEPGYHWHQLRRFAWVFDQLTNGTLHRTTRLPRADVIPEPDEDLWKLLRARGEPAASGPAHELSMLVLGLAPPDALCAAAVADHTPDRVRDVLVPLCSDRGLAPTDPVERAVFFLLTGQLDQYRAADPDGALLAVAYQAATPQRRERLRHAMVDAGDLDLVHVVVGAEPRDRARAMLADERRYLVDQLAERREWERLWQLLTDLPLSDAVAAARRIAGRWRPASQRDGELLTQLNAVPVEPVERVVDRATADRQIRLHLDAAEVRRIEDCALSPDGRRLAIAERLADRHDQLSAVITEVDLPGGRPVTRYRSPMYTTYVSMLQFGDVLVAGTQHIGLHRGHEGQWVRYQVTGTQADPDAVVAGSPIAEMRRLVATRDGFAAAASTTRHALLFGTPHAAELSVTALPDDVDFNGVRDWALAADADSGLLAVAAHELMILDERATRVVARARASHVPGFPIEHVAFVGPDHLVTWSRDRLTRWALNGDTLTATRVRGVSLGIARGRLTALPHLDQIVANVRFGTARAVFMDATTLHEIDHPLGVGTDGFPPFRRVWSTTDGRHMALLVDDPHTQDAYVIVRGPYREPIDEVLARPLHRATPADLDTVVEALGDRAHNAATREVLEVLSACLRHRFGAEITLGSTERPRAGPDDIALSPDEPDDA